MQPEAHSHSGGIRLGTHYLLDLQGCDPGLLNDVAQLSRLLTSLAKQYGATVLQTCLQQFQPQGVTGVLVLAESHLALHTWPEHGAAAADLFSCTPALDGEAFCQELASALNAQAWQVQTIVRGQSQLG